MVKHNQPGIGLHCLWHLTPEPLGRDAVRQQQKAGLHSGLNQLGAF